MRHDWTETFFKLATFMLVAALAYVGLTTLTYLRDVLTIVISAMLVAYVLQLAVEPLSRRMPRWLAVTLVVLSVFVALTLVLALIVPMVIGQVQQLVANLPQDLDHVQAQLTQISQQLEARRMRVDLRLDSWILPRLASLGQSAANNLPGLVMGSFTGFLTTAMILVCAFYFLKDGEQQWRNLMALLPERAASQANYYRIELDKSLAHYLRGQLLNAGVVFVSASMAFTLLGMEYGIVAALIWGTAEIIPYFGLYLGLGTSLLLAALQGGPVVGKVLLAGLVIWWVKDNIVAPRVMSHATGLHPILIIVAVLTGGKLAGFLGILLAIPVTAVLTTTIRFWLLQRKLQEEHLAEERPLPSVSGPTHAVSAMAPSTQPEV